MWRKKVSIFHTRTMFKISTFVLTFTLILGVAPGDAAETTLSLSTALREGLRNHPSIITADANLRIRIAETLAVTEIPNPRLETEFRALNDKPLVELKLMQPLKRSYFGLRQNYAMIEKTSARADARAQVAGVLNDVFSRYVELWSVQALQAVRSLNREDLLSLREDLERTVKVGQGSAVDLALLDAEIANQAAERTALESQRLSRSAALARRIARTDGRVITVEQPSGLALPKNSAALERFAVSRTPLRLAILKREEAARAALAIAHSDSRGNMEAGLIADFDSERDDFLIGVGFTFDLPVWNRNEAGIAKAEAAIGAARSELRQVEPARVSAIVRLRYQSALSAERSAREYRETVVPLFQDALVKAREAINRGQAGVTLIQPVITRLTETRLRAFELQITAVEARAELEAALGGRLEEALATSVKN